ncbi:hypothetical protein [Sulfurospirillum sp. UCH001]|uniref:hypothetical protein n=1 Tax=Sulfurospirillum sp. UCH001 TaxID=1581011 RepID=UPI00083331D3|nr:hypothetical protein [Sulfurospirillum sp. UCH001]
MKLALGIGSFEQHMLNSTKYLNTITEYNILVITDEFLPNKYTMPTFLTDKHGHVIQSFDTFFHTFDFELVMSTYTRCVVFIGIGGGYSTTVLQKILANSSSKSRKKLFIIAVRPFDFEGKNKHLCAKEMERTFHKLDVQHKIFSDRNLIHDCMHQDINTYMDGFYKMLYEAIPREKECR